MKNLLSVMLLSFLVGMTACRQSGQNNTKQMQATDFITEAQANAVIGQLKVFRIERGVRQVAGLWREEDGTADDFSRFCRESFVGDTARLSQLFTTLERNFEVIRGYYHKMDVMLKAPLQLQGPEITEVDMMFGGYDASAHLTDDLYANKVAFLAALNFPFYSLEEKTELGAGWSRKEWAYARMGDRFISRVPASVQQDISATVTQADAYISDYNIYMGNLRNDAGEQLFPSSMKLISHWGLRDELKSNYSDPENGLEKQRMIYEVMRRIIDQSIPTQVINSDRYLWNPATNGLYDTLGKAVDLSPEGVRRYEVFLKNFHAMRQLDPYSPHYPTQLARAFDGTMEVPQKDVEGLFRELLSSPQVKEVAAFIGTRLGRPLEPFDIWYNGFKSGGGIPEGELTAITSRKYPTAEALQEDLPVILGKLGWTRERAKEITALE